MEMFSEVRKCEETKVKAKFSLRYSTDHDGKRCRRREKAPTGQTLGKLKAKPNNMGS